MEIREVQNHKDAEMTVALIQEFVEWLRERYVDNSQAVDDYVEKEGLVEEFAALTKLSLPPHRKILIAIEGDEAAGTVMLNRVDETTCQMNRLFVSDKYRGQSLGRKLCLRLIELAGELGYQRMRLHTTHRQIESKQLYQSLGFEPCADYGAGGTMAEHYELGLEQIDSTKFKPPQSE